MQVAGIIGWHDSGKTTLVVALVAELTARGHTVSTMKHAHHGFDVDTPGKDSWRHRDAGATQVIVGSSARWALMHELRDGPEPSSADLLKHMAPVDLVLIEGFKRESHRKIEVYRRGLKDKPIALEDPTVIAIATDGSVPDLPENLDILDVNDPAAIADYIERQWDLDRPAATSGGD